MSRILVSACLLGEAVRYDGRAKALDDSVLARLQRQGRVVAFCPECAGGLGVPRPPAEIRGGDGDAVLDGRARVETNAGVDVTAAFVAGAEAALALCRKHDVHVAVLTESSPSCGSRRVYDGSFRRRAIGGAGVTAALLRREGIEVYSQFELAAALRRLQS